ncbi:MAG: response regulator [Tenuifilaceae bacterium]
MKLANRLLKFSSFNLEGKCEKDAFIKILLLSVFSLVLIAFFIIQSIFAILLMESLLLMIVSIITALLLAINLSTIIKRKETNGLATFAVIVCEIGLLLTVILGDLGIIGTMILGTFPFLAISVLGSTKGGSFSISLGILFMIVCFIPIEGNLAYQQTFTFKIFLFISYLAALTFAYLYEHLKQRIIQNTEKEMLDQKNVTKLKEEFIAKLSHQIRTPLNNIMVISNILTNSELDDKQRDMIDTIQASTNNLVNVVNSMVEISNVDLRERGDFNINFNIQTTISNTLKLFSSQSLNNIIFNLKIDENLPKNFFGDPVKIKQIFLNIIESIIKNKSSNKATIDIRIGKSKDAIDDIELYFEIKSNCPIMLPINESYSQFLINETTFTSASTQIYIELLDLSITQKLIDSNGGKLSIVLSSENAVFAFPYRLSRIADSSDFKTDTKVSDEIRVEKTKLQPSVELSNSSVLLVEDNLINQKIVILSLKKLVKNIEIANNGKEALDKFGTSKYDIILMDIQMPIMNGIVTTKKIREIEESTNSHTPIIAITANALLGDKEDCIAAGMDDYISKPFQIEVLIHKMRNLLKS